MLVRVDVYALLAELEYACCVGNVLVELLIKLLTTFRTPLKSGFRDISTHRVRR